MAFGEGLILSSTLCELRQPMPCTIKIRSLTFFLSLSKQRDVLDLAENPAHARQGWIISSWFGVAQFLKRPQD